MPQAPYLRFSLAGMLLLTALAGAGCSPSNPTPAAPDPVQTQEPGGASHHHVHIAPHGGTLVELGEHAANLEFLLDPAQSSLTLYALDAHAENPVRLPDKVIEAILIAPDGSQRSMQFDAVASPLTGETVGDTSAFHAVDPAFQEATSFTVLIPRIIVRGVPFELVEYHRP